MSSIVYESYRLISLDAIRPIIFSTLGDVEAPQREPVGGLQAPSGPAGLEPAASASLMLYLTSKASFVTHIPAIPFTRQARAGTSGPFSSLRYWTSQLRHSP